MTKFSIEEATARSKAFNAKLNALVESDPELKSSVERKKQEIELAITLREAREKAHITQEELANRLHTTKSAISRLESCGLTRSTPSLGTLLKYANAIGYELQFTLTPLQKT